MILNRFGVRGRLNLLLLLPVIAVLLVATPLVVGQVNDARAAGRTADTAGQAQRVSGLVWELQRELLLTSAYVASPAADPGPVLDQQRAVADAVEGVRAGLGPTASDELTGALTRLGSLDELRRNAVVRGVSLDSLARTYHAVTEAVIDALRLVPKGAGGTAGLDAESAKALTELEALLRAGEYSSLRGTALITATSSPVAGRKLLTDATANAQILTQRFVQQADVDHAALLVLVDQGDAGRRVDALSRQLPNTADPVTTAAFVSTALGSAEAQASLRRTVQDRVTAEIAQAADARGDAARALAVAVGFGALALLGVVVALSVIVSRSISDPLRRLTTSATTVADLTSTELTRVSDSEDSDEHVPQLAEVDVPPGGEVGELATAFNRVQSTAAAMLDRQSSNRRNVSLMFANVARRTQNLAQRQLAVVDELERNEQDPTLLERLYRLDHLSTRLRRSADKLLVIAGDREQSVTTKPIELATALRSALAEIEDYKRVRIGAICEVTLTSSVAADLVLLFAELLENATASSPPDSEIELTANIRSDGSCLVLVVDHGVGMPREQLVEENRRLVERERLDVAPTGVLGLFVVGRLARRHSLGVELAETPGGGITALVAIPAELLVSQSPARPALAPAVSAEPPAPSAISAIVIPPPRSSDDGFLWFDTDIAPSCTGASARAELVAAYAPSGTAAGVTEYTPQDQLARGSEHSLLDPAVPDIASAVLPPDADGGPRHGLRRRVPGAQLPSTASVSAPEPARTTSPRHDALAARSAMDEYQAATRHAPGPHDARQDPPEDGPTALAGEHRGGLTRRVPGATLSDGPALEPSAATVKITAARGGTRDADADRRAFDEFAAGLARATHSVSQTTSVPGATDGRRGDHRKESTQ